jgi:quinoprotein glucose dehydrogenase
MFVGMRKLTATLLVCATSTVGAQSTTGEWSAYGRDAFGSRFSPLTQITRENVSRLEVAWTYRTGEIDIPTRQPAKLEATPLMVDGTLYLSTPLGRVIALDPETG